MADRAIGELTTVGTKSTELQSALIAITGSETWLDTPNQAFGGRRPRELLDNGEFSPLWQMIYEVESGACT